MEDKKDEKDNKEEITIGEKAEKQIANVVQSEFEKNKKAIIDESVDKKLEVYISQQEDTKKKELQKSRNKFFGDDVEKDTKINNMLHAFVSKDVEKLALMKDYLRTGSNPKAGYLVPPEEYIREIYDVEEEYGVARREATVRATDRTEVHIPKLTSSISLSTGSEAGSKTVTTPTFALNTLTLIKKDAVVPITEEMIEDSAFDLKSYVTGLLAEQFAYDEDVAMFTDATTGVVNQAGVATITTATNAITSLTFDNVNQAIYSVPTKSMNGGKFFFNRAVLGVLQRIKDSDNQYIWKPGPNGAAEGTIWNQPYVLVEVMPSLLTANTGVAYIIFGNLKRYTQLVDRTGIRMKLLEEGTIIDGETEYNLAQQDMVAIRAHKRFNTGVIFDSAFCIIQTA